MHSVLWHQWSPADTHPRPRHGTASAQRATVNSSAAHPAPLGVAPGSGLRHLSRSSCAGALRFLKYVNRAGPFWDAVASRTPLPPASELLGFKLLEVDPERATIKVEFQARPEFVNPVGVIQGGFLVSDDVSEDADEALVYHISPQRQQQTYVAPCTKNTGWLSVARSISSKGEFVVTPRAALVNEGSFSARHLFRTCAASGFNSSTA